MSKVTGMLLLWATLILITCRSLQVSMKWSLPNSKSVGPDGMFYFNHQKPAKLLSAKNVGQSLIIPILPYSTALLPQGTEWLNIFEMRNRQLLNEVGDRVFGFLYYSQPNQKLGLVGTIARIKSRTLFDDGRVFVVVEGIEKFFIKELVRERPYLIGKVTLFTDVTEKSDNVNELNELERKIFEELRSNVKMMQLLTPGKNHIITPAVLENIPPMQTPDIRDVYLGGQETDMARRERFTYGVMNMLDTTTSSKLSLLQELVLENRYEKILTALRRGGSVLQDQIKDRGVMDVDGLRTFKENLKEQLVIQEADTNNTQDRVPENFKDGKWVQMATMM